VTSPRDVTDCRPPTGTGAGQIGHAARLLRLSRSAGPLHTLLGRGPERIPGPVRLLRLPVLNPPHDACDERGARRPGGPLTRPTSALRASR
jgi:hypothetical protein